MALTAPALHNLRPINTRFSMGDDFSEELRESVEKTLVREQSFGNQLYRSITPDWFMENRDLVETFIQDPNDPQLLDEIQQPREGQASARMPSINEHKIQNPFSSAAHPPFPQIPAPKLEASSPYQLSPASLNEPQFSQTPRTMGGSHSLPPPAAHGHMMLPHSSSSPAIEPIETPNKSVSRSSMNSGLRSYRTSPLALSRPESAPLPGTSVESRRWSGEMNVGLISLAEKAASMGAPHKAITNRHAAPARPAESADVSQTISRSSDEEGAEGSLSINQDEPKKRGPGRRKRTEPVLVETEEGETKWVSPTEYRKLRRRITNRLSARRMRAKHASEKEKTEITQVELERQLHDQSKRMNALEQTNEQLAGQLRECIAQRDHFSLECQRMQRYIESQQTIAYPQSQEAFLQPSVGYQQQYQQEMPQFSNSPHSQPFGRMPRHSREASFGATVEPQQNFAQMPADMPIEFPMQQMDVHALHQQAFNANENLGVVPQNEMLNLQQQEPMDYQMHPPNMYHQRNPL